MSATKTSPFMRPSRDASYLNAQEVPSEVAELTRKVMGAPPATLVEHGTGQKDRGAIKVATHLTKEEHRQLRIRVAEMDTTIERYLHSLLFPSI